MRIRSLAVAAALLAFGVPATASAYQATTISPVNVRAGAGSNFTRLATLPSGASLWVDFCQSGWCAVNADGVTGWVARRYLAGAGGGAYSYRPPSLSAPAIPRYVPPLVIPRGHVHDYGYSSQHKFQRRFQKKWKSRHGSAKHDGKDWRRHPDGRNGRSGKNECPEWMCRL